MAFGFVVARFGLFLWLLQIQGQSSHSHGLSPYLGAVLVGLGVLATAGGAVQYQRFCRTIPSVIDPRRPARPLCSVSDWALVGIGLALGLVLVV